MRVLMLALLALAAGLCGIATLTAALLGVEVLLTPPRPAGPADGCPCPLCTSGGAPCCP